MKKILYIMLALTIASTSLIAKNTLTNKYGKAINVEAKRQQPTFNNESVQQGPVFNSKNSNYSKFLGVDNSRHTNLVDMLGNSIFNWNYQQEMTSPITFEPTLGDNGLIAIMNMEPDYTVSLPSGGPGRLTLSMYYSTDGGFNWTSRDSLGFYSTTPYYYTSPSLALTNTNQSQSIGGLETGVKETFDYAIYSRNFLSSGNTYSGMGMFVNLADLDEPFVADYRNPSINNSPDVQMWGFALSASSNAVNNSGLYFVSMMSPDGTYQYGYYGNIGLNTSGGGEVTGDAVQPQWWTSKFKDAGNIGSTYQNKPTIATDPEGNVYVASNNMFADDNEVRIPAVWKSANGGATFTEANRCPVAVINDIAGTLSPGANAWFAISYSQDAFVVYGNDKYSYFMRVVSRIGEENKALHIVEANYDGGVWSARKVCDISENIGTGLSQPTWLSYFSRVGQRFQFADTLQLPLLEEVNNRGHELEAAVTADGSAIVVKYLDWAGSKTVTFKGKSGADTTYTYYTVGNNEFGLEDTIPVTVSYDMPNDIFVASRNVSETSWGPEYNVTNDNWNYKSTFMPKTIPSLSAIPIAISNPAIITNPASRWYNAVGKLDLSFWSQVSWYWFQGIDVITVDGTKNATEGNSAWMSVENGVKNNFELFDPFPNPTANEVVDISFSLMTPGFARVTVSDAMGRLIATPFEGMLSAGTKGFNFNTTKLTTGTYYINLSVGNNTATKILNVIK